MDKFELQTRLQAALNEQKRWTDFDPVLAAYHEGRASVFSDALAALTRAAKTANDAFKKLGVEIKALGL